MPAPEDIPTAVGASDSDSPRPASGADRCRLSRIWSIIIAVAGGVLVEAATVYGAARTGFVLPPAAGFVFILALLGLYAGLLALLKRFGVRTRLALLTQAGFWLVPASLLLVQQYRDGTPEGFFRRCGLHPMPPSVRDFRWYGGAGIDGFYQFSFTAEPGDTRRLIQSARLSLDAQSQWFSGTSPSPETNLNLALSNCCLRAGFRFAWLASPVVYASTNRANGSWYRQLVTDQEHRRVYLFLN